MCEYTPKEVSNPKKISNYTKEEIATAIEMIQQAKRPFIYVGGGAIASEASEEVRSFAEKIQAPVCDTLMAREFLMAIMNYIRE